MLVYRCAVGHVRHLRDDAGQQVSCRKCKKEAVRLTPDEVTAAGTRLVFNARRAYQLSE